MLQQLSKEEYQVLLKIPGLFSFPLVGAVVEKRQEGNVYVDSIANPGIVFVIHKAGFSYLYHRDESLDCEQLLEFFLNEGKLPVYFHLYDPPEQLINCSLKTEKLGVKIRSRIQLQYKSKTIDTIKYKPAISITVSAIDAENFDTLETFNLQLTNKFWSSKDDFLTNGFGFVLHNQENLPVAICYSAGISNTLAEVDIMTMPEYQGLGLAKFATAVFIEEGLKRNIITNWDCFEENIGSLKIAQAMGFAEIIKYSFLSLYNKKYE
ncbi:MAG: GNAT family N-acetyltransferase [Bacteroidetes bacterium]|nr:MAG: GNAT family N-acetyltransferase [Bacteroidota bacterium]